MVRRRLGIGAGVLALLLVQCGDDRSERRRSRSEGAEGGEDGGESAGGRAGKPSLGGASGTAGTFGAAGSATAGTSAAGAAGSGAGSGGAMPAGAAGRAGAGAGSSGTAGSVAGSSTTSGGTGGTPAPTGALSIDKVAFYQATEVTLWEDGAAVESTTPIVSARGGMLRVWLAPGSSWSARPIAAELEVETAAGSSVLELELNVTRASSDAELGSTLAFQLPASSVTETTRLSLRVRETDGTPIVLWPSSGDTELGAQSSNGPLSITLVPLVSNGFAPDLDTQTLALYRDHIRALYPVPDVELRVRDPVTLKVDVLGDDYGTGWDEALDALYQVRADDDPASNDYYYGVLAPARTMDDYCPEACVVGLSVLAGRNDEMYRGAVGTGFFDSDADTFTQETLEHELGHALGRDHSPCDTGGDFDPRFPYSDGKLGVWGWDGTKLRNPRVDTDVMGYCIPVWVSDYTFAGLFTRIQYVNGLSARLAHTARLERTPVRTLVLRADGTLRWGGEKRTPPPASDETQTVELLDAAGAVLHTLDAPLGRFDHLPGGFVSLEPELLRRPGVVAVRVGGASIMVP